MMMVANAFMSTMPILLHFSPHGIAIPKGLHFTAVVYLSFFFRRLICEVTERIATKLGYIFTYDCYLKLTVSTEHLSIMSLMTIST